MEKLQQELDKLKGKFNTLCDALICPVCLDTLRKDHVLCVNGHAICAECKERQQTCPSCRGQFSNVNQNSVVRHILEVLLPKCKYEKCLYRVKPGDDHEKYCCHRQTSCNMPYCSWQGTVKDLINHLQEVHALQLLSENNLNVCHVNFDLHKYSLHVNLYSAHGHYLWQIGGNDPTLGLLTYTYIPVFNGKPTNDILVTRCFKSPKKDFTSTIRIVMKEDVDHVNENLISFPRPMLYNFWNKNELKLFFDLTITKVVD